MAKKDENKGSAEKAEQSIIIYNTLDGKAKVALMAKDGNVWMNQNQIAELFDTSKQNVGAHIANVLQDKELDENSVVKYYFTTWNAYSSTKRIEPLRFTSISRPEFWTPALLTTMFAGTGTFGSVDWETSAIKCV